MNNMKVAVLLEDLYEPLEAWYPYLRLREEGILTVFIGTGKKHYEGKHGYPATEELSVQKASVEDFIGVVIPGGYAPDLLRRSQEVLHFVSRINEAGKLVAAICHAGWVPISAGIVKNKRATCFFAIKDDLINAGAEYIDKEVVVDGNLITSRMPSDLPYFCTEIIRFLKTQKS